MKKTTFILVLILLMSVCGYAQSRKITAAANSWPPFVNSSDPQGGLSLAIVKAAYATQGYSVDMHIIPWARAKYEVKIGKIDILPDTWITADRKTYLMFSSPYVYNEIKFIKRKNDPFEYNGIKSLTGKTIGVIRGYGYEDQFLKATNFTREEVDDMITNIKMLVTGRIDMTIGDAIVTTATISKTNPEWLKEIDFTQNSLSRNGLHVACGIQNPRHEELISAFNRGLQNIKASGVLDKILKQYGYKNDNL